MFVDEHPLVSNLDVDVIRGLLGRWIDRSLDAPHCTPMRDLHATTLTHRFYRSVGRMLSALVPPWSHVVFGSLIGPAVGIAALWLLRELHLSTVAATAIGVFAGTWLWNLMLNIRHAGVIDGDIAFKPFPISWQDTGTGLFSFAFATALLLATTHRKQRGHRTLKIAAIASAAALIMDIYTW